MKDNKGLVEYVKAQLGNPYWYGTFGQIATQSIYEYNKGRYPDYYKATDFKTQIGKRVHDCVGLIKGYMWSETPYSVPKYKSNDFEDYSANGLYAACSKKSTNMDILPEIPGIAVFMNGHVGVYIGGGYVIEARGHSYGVVKTNLSERKWIKWAYIKGLKYVEGEASIGQPVWGSRTLKKGDSGHDVETLQNKLMRKGYNLPKYGADGSFGAETEAALKNFQKANGLPVDGICDKDDYNALDKETVEKVTIAAGTWNIRSAPSVNSVVLGYAKSGETYIMTGRKDNGFIEIQFQKATAWISLKGVK